MSISDLYASGKHKQEVGHFANLVKVAIANNTISEGEQQFLNKAAKKLNISEEEYSDILKSPDKYPINPPIGYDESIERLYRLTKMVYADGHIHESQVHLLRKVATALSIPLDNVEKVCDEAIHLVMNNNDLEAFTGAIKKVNAV